MLTGRIWSRIHTTMKELTEEEITALTIYNAEIARGLIHTPAYEKKMAELQWRYYIEVRNKAVKHSQKSV